MPLFLESEVRFRAHRATGMNFSAASLLNELMAKQEKVDQPDIFLSHAYDDREIVLGVALKIEDLGYSVYIDWRDDPTLDRKEVTPATAAKLRKRMRASKCLFYSVTPSASVSTWMKWELGYMDGYNHRTAILPISSATTEKYSGQEFLGLYPYVSDGVDRTTGKPRLWIHRSEACYIKFKLWLAGYEPPEHH